jgi:hypothetical protein
MRNTVSFNNSDVNEIQRNTAFNSIIGSESVSEESRQFSEKFISEGKKNLYEYLEWLGLANEKEYIILPSNNHFFYESEEIKNVKAITSLRELNKTRDLKKFLHSLYNNLQPKSYFIGCFKDDSNRKTPFVTGETSEIGKIQKEEDIENGISSRNSFLNLLYNILDAKIFNSLSGRTVNSLLKDSGFLVVDMTTYNGMTFFCAQRQPAA